MSGRKSSILALHILETIRSPMEQLKQEYFQRDLSPKEASLLLEYLEEMSSLRDRLRQSL